jgi:death-on-curing protein
MAAAYLFHLCQNHAFLDGNKRVGLLACEAFLRLNGQELAWTNQEAEEMTLRLAEGELSKEDLTHLVEQNLRLLNRG